MFQRPVHAGAQLLAKGPAPEPLGLKSLLHPAGEGAGADEFLPLLSLVLAHCDLPELLLEAQYMSELLEPAMLTGEGKGRAQGTRLPGWGESGPPGTP